MDAGADTPTRTDERLGAAVTAAESVVVKLVALPFAAAVGAQACVARAVHAERSTARPAKAAHPVPAPLTPEGVVATAAAVVEGVCLAIGGGAALLYVVARGAHARVRQHRWTEVEPQWRRTT
ncbi:hypothetical protein [Saccharothrix coeruleofusca]|uniref:Uncharacterized protein n=1 Tax=Saccharothrix coeruleofusca TaxID=33919 RepID=A0A918ATW8_9PSEU|nr:hypothetical protein [Saccharothrix coeruleofusca]GGP75739.1 hypothetical protein GCM10010185_56890 [Saccharothrix coeruleofusca]